MPFQMLSGPTIDAGQSLSNSVDCSAGAVIRLTMPAQWLSAPLTFQTSPDNAVFYELVRGDGREVSITAPANATVALATHVICNWLKIRSGTLTQPVIQPQSRTFTLAVDSNPSLLKEE